MVQTAAPQTPDDPEEKALAAFLETLPSDRAVTVRTLAHAWQGGGGTLQVGQWAIRLLAAAGDGPNAGTFTAGTLHRPRDPDGTPRLELCRVILHNNGVPEAAWTHWSDEFADLAPRGFDPTAKFPTLPLDDALTPTDTARLAVGLRDLALLCGAEAAPGKGR